MDTLFGNILSWKYIEWIRKNLKKMFAVIASMRGFSQLSNFWFIESEECIFIIELLKSSYGNYYYLELKIFIQGVFGKKYTISKELGKTWRDVHIRLLPEYDIFLDLDTQLSYDDRKQGIESAFNNFVMPFSKKALFLSGICLLWNENQILMSDALRNQVEKLIEAKKSQQPE